MSIWSRLLGAIKKPQSVAKPAYGIPTVKFDPSQVTETVKADIRKNVERLEDIGPEHFDRVYDATVRSVMEGYKLSLLFNVLMEMNISGMTKRRAGQIAINLSGKVTTIINRERQQELGIKRAVWLYSGATCDQHDSAHAAANGKQYDVSKGLYLDGKWTWPGYEDGCRCVSRSIIKGFKY